MSTTNRMMIRAIPTVLIWTMTVSFATAQVDRVRTTRGSTTGEVQSTTPIEVTVSKNSGNETIPVNEIRSIIFRDEPNELTQVRVMILERGAYREALDRLGRIEDGDLDRDLIRQDVEFYRALCAARLALAGHGDLREAGPKMMDFVRNGRSSYHYFEACETLGDLFVAIDRYRNAEQQYGELAKAPWPEYRARASLLVGRALAAQGKHAEAVRRFDEAIQLAGDGDQGKAQRLAATLGKAISQAAAGETNEAVAQIEEVIGRADPEDVQLHALAYNALGRCYEQANKPKDALLAYLHVDVLYSAAAKEHAEALTHLATLWETVGQDGRARDARQRLQDNYGTQ